MKCVLSLATKLYFLSLSMVNHLMKKQILLVAGMAALLCLTACHVKDPNQDIIQADKGQAEPNVLPVGIKKIASVAKKGDEIVIPFTKFQLDNGLTVILHPDNSDPLVHVDITYHVGSGREEPGKSGFAHFFEHMMFQGSENVADEQHFGLITESGAWS